MITKSLYFLFAFLFILILSLLTLTFYQETKTTADLKDINSVLIQKDSELIHFQEYGTKSDTAYIFIHGTGSWSETWKPVISNLKKDKHYIAIDIPPFGLSTSSKAINLNEDANKIIFLINELKLKHVYLIGHSFGGRATLKAANLLKGKILGITLVDVALGFDDKKHTNSNFQLPTSFYSFFSLLGANKIFTSLELRQFVFQKEKITPEILISYQKQLALQGKHKQISKWLKNFMENQSELNDFSNPDFYKDFNFPVHIIWGDKDDITPIEHAHILKKLIPHSTLSIMPEVGHIPMIEDFNSFLEIFQSNI